jgi:hypothetical protein
VNSVYWQKRHLRIKGNEQYTEEIRQRDKELNGYKKLITLTVRCRNLSQKIAQEVGSLISKQLEKVINQPIDLHYIEFFRNENRQLIHKLNELETDKEIGLSDESQAYRERLTHSMNLIHDLIKNLMVLFTNQAQNPTDYEFLNQEMRKNCNDIIEHHKWIVNQFQKVFKKWQQV